jgi:hypothetical protein
MYYVESLIDGELHYKNSRRGQWFKFTSSMLNDRIVELEKRLLTEFKEYSDDFVKISNDGSMEFLADGPYETTTEFCSNKKDSAND